MKVPSEPYAHRSTSQMSDESTSSSSSDSSDEEESSSSGEETTQISQEIATTLTPTSYLHEPWLLQNREDSKVNTVNEQAPDSNQEDSSGSPAAESNASGSDDDGDDDDEEQEEEEEEPTTDDLPTPTKQTGSRARKDLPEWESNPLIYGLRRSSRQKKEPERLNIEDEDSDGDTRKSRRKRRESDAAATLSGSSEEESSEYESSSNWKKAMRTNNRSSKLNQMRARLQGRKVKNLKSSKGHGSKASKGRSRRTTDSTVSDEEDAYSDDNQPVRASSRIQRKQKNISYKENDSTQETDSDDVMEVAEKEGEAEEDQCTESIEKIMDHRYGRLGATGGKTTAYAIINEGDPNDGFNKESDEGEIQYFIKWSGWSHLHNTWESEDTLKAQNVRGMKRLENFIKRQEEIDVWLRASSPEDREYYYCQNEMNRNVLGNYCKVDRIIARSRVKNQHDFWDYQVKWCGLPYSECTWEDEQLLVRDFKAEIDAFDMRQDNPCVPRSDCKVLRHRPRFVPMTRQPDWFAGRLELRDYQLEGVNWISHSWCKGNSVILADEMGLGKTIQSIVFLSYLYHTHELYGLFLVIVPLSTMTAWQSEFKLWAPFMNTIVYMGDQTSRATIRDIEWKFPNNRYKFNAVLTSYEILLKDKSFLGSHSWAVIAVDEAHRLKNDDSLLYKSLIEFKSNHRLLITGTPLQNTLKELWALLHFIMPDKFEAWETFEAAHAQNRDSGYASLHKVLQPYLLRRVKKDVEKSLPAKVEQILRIPMSSQQKQYYKWILTKNYEALTRGNRGSHTSFCNIVMELKKCCNHAYLVKPPELEPVNHLQSLLRNSGKMVLLDKLLLRLKEDGHRVLIFSQMVRMLDIIQDYLISRRLQFQRLDGSVSSDKRRRALDHFNADSSEDFCFLLSTRAGGLGINLATADTVVIFDSDWNPMNDLQAQARAHRIGQKNQVNIYRLVCAGSVEEDIIERAKKKMVLDHLVIQRMDTSGKTVLFKNSTPSSKANNPFNKEELTSILKFGAEELFTEADADDEPDCDIDEILKRAETRQEQIGSSAGDELLSAFKVATLNFEEEEESADLGKDWNDIIPEKDRILIEEENRRKKEAELYLPRRARKKLKVTPGSDSENAASADSGSSEDEEDDGEAPRKRGRPQRRKGDDDRVKGFTTAEVRRFVRSFRRFGDPLSRLDAIARDAELSEQSEADLQRLGQQLYDKLHETKSTPESQEPKEDPATGGSKQGRGRGPSFRIAGVSVSVKTTMACISDLQPLVDVIPKKAEERREFRLSIPVRPIWKWDCSWDSEDDARLLVGIYEYGMGSWEQIQSDPALKLDKKIMRPNNEKPQAKQLQSRSEYLIKLLRKAQEQNHPGVSPAFAGSQPRRRAPPRDNDGKTKRSRKIKSKSRVDDVGSDVDDATMTTPAHVVAEDQAKQENGTSKTNDAETKKRGRRKRKAAEVGETPATSSKPNEAETNNEAVKEKRRKKHKVPAKDPAVAAAKKKKGPVHITAESEPVPVGNEEFSGELDPATFNECKERLRPVKKALRQLDRPPPAPDGKEEQVRAEHTRSCLLQIGDRVIQCLREFHDPERIKTLRRNLWIFVSKFTELDAEKLHKMYKHAIKRREQDRKAKTAEHSKPTESHGDSKKHASEEHKQQKERTSLPKKTDTKSRKIHHKEKAKKKSSSPPPADGSRDQPDVSPKPGRSDLSTDSKPERQSTHPRPRQGSPQRHHFEDKARYPPSSHGSKPFDDRENWNRRHAAGGRSPPGSTEYSGRDPYAKRKRSPFPGDPRSAATPANRSPVYPRDHEYREERHSRDFGPSPPHHHHPPDRDRERYWRGHRDFRGSPPPAGYYPPPGASRDWEGRGYPPRGGYPPYHHAPRSPGRSPHAEFGHHRRRRPEYPAHGSEGARGSRGPRYGGYNGSPPSANFSPPTSDNSMDSIRRSEKT